jgi:RNA-binding protein 25
MPSFNFNAPVIRLGTAGGRAGAVDSPGGGRRDNATGPPRRGLGMDRDGDRRNEVQQVFPPSREEIARTIFISSIPDGVGGDEGMERILETAGKLVRWTRATDANNKPQTFGFAEFGDAQSLETAAAIFTEVRVPVKRQKPGQVKKADGEEEDVETTQLQIMVDDASIKYADEWSKTRNDDEATVQFRLDTAKEALSHVLASFFHPPNAPVVDYAGDTTMQDAHDSENVEVAFVNLATGEDELADIPADMREIVAAEIAAFRDRSNQRDRERLRREEELEAEERRRSGRRVASPPPSSAPTGPGGANGVPLGPRAERGVQGAPSGPKGSHFPRDYQNGVNFVNGGAVNNGAYISREDEDDSASDSEIERRRKKKRDEELDNEYQQELKRWLNHERRTYAAIERTNEQSKQKDAQHEAARAKQAKQLADFDDDHEATAKRHPYYHDHSEYIREREKARGREMQEDGLDREQERGELAAQTKERDHARGQADAFLEELREQDEESMRKEEERREPSHFKISLGAATKKLEKTAAPRRTAADVENLLEDEEVADQSGSKRKPLIPINFDAAVRANLTQEEIEEAQRQLAREIPNDKEGLWKWPVSWEHLPEKNVDKDIKQWAANKILDVTGLQEDMLVDAIIDHLKSRGGPQPLVENLEVVSF